MRAGLVFVACLAAFVPAMSTPLFESWKVSHGKTYSSPEENAVRAAIFAANVARVNKHNVEGHSWTMAINEFADLTSNEFALARTGGYLPKNLRRHSRKAVSIPSLTDATAVDGSNDDPMPSAGPAPSGSVDWTTKGAVTPVKNQGQCGSCWAFSTTGSTEGVNFINKGKLVSLSEQQLVDCSGAQGNQGCNGGLMDDAFQYIITNGGICGESAYPYTGADGTCATTCTKLVQIKGFTDVTKMSDSAMAAAVTKNPVSIAIEADQSSFQMYSSGVMTAACGTALDHGVLAVGFGIDPSGGPYWKVKNSWGASWGEAGYIRLGRGAQYNSGAGQCGIYSQPSFPTQ